MAKQKKKKSKLFKRTEILGVKRTNFIVYLSIFVISLALIFFVFIPNEKAQTIFVSIGASGLASALVGYFVDFANVSNNSKIRERVLHEACFYYKLSIERILSSSFRMMINIYDEKPSENLYKTTIKEYREAIEDKFSKYDERQYTIEKQSGILSLNELELHKNAENCMKNCDSSINSLSFVLSNLFNQDLFGLLNYFNQNEIDYMKGSLVNGRMALRGL